jgi:REP element-mobilizing transposase RayT
MSQSLARNYAHFIFSTKERQPFLSQPDVRNEMHKYLGGVCNELDCQSIAVGGAADHVHILCLLSRKISGAEFIGKVKSNSSKWIKQKGGIMSKFAWQSGYALFSASPSHVDSLIEYIAGQAEHHKNESYQDEFRRICKMYHVEYDERYVWD